MMNAAKLNLKISTDALEHSVVTPHQTYMKMQRYGKDFDCTPAPSTTWNVSNPEAFTSQLPKELLDVEVPQVFLLTLPAVDANDGYLPPHVDYNKSCGINVYLQANGEKTKFYEWKNKKAEFVEEFEASSGECWLMNTSEPHSVALVKNKERSMLTFSFVNTPYSEVLKYVDCHTG